MLSRRGKRRASRRSLFSWLKSARVRAVLSLGIVLGFGAVSTMAYWTDNATVTGGTFTAGKLDVKVGNPAVDDNPPQFTTDFALPGMIPGSTKDATLKITNAGTVPFTFKIDGTATNSGAGTDQLGAALKMTVFTGAACTGTPIAASTLVPMNGAILATQASLPASGTKDFCFRATLLGGASTDLQGKLSVVTLTVTANQIPIP